MMLEALAGITQQQGAGGFNPSDISGLVGWWDASDSGTITSSNGDVSQWDDKSASGLNVSNAGSNVPQTGINTLNSLNVFSFDSGDRLDVTPVTKICNSAFSIFTVFRKTGANASSGFEAHPFAMSSGFVGRPFTGWSNSATTSRYYIGTSSSTGFASLRSATSWGIWTLTAQDTSGSALLSQRVDGAFDHSATLTPSGGWSTASQRVTIASRDDGGVQLRGDIAEIVVYDTLLSAGDISDVETYLNTKWAVY
jgi:hypothetical protein